jgi:hypothetical protein
MAPTAKSQYKPYSSVVLVWFSKLYKSEMVTAHNSSKVISNMRDLAQTIRLHVGCSTISSANRYNQLFRPFLRLQRQEATSVNDKLWQSFGDSYAPESTCDDASREK